MSPQTPFSRRVLAGAAFAVGFSAAPAFAQMVCGQHADIEKRLEQGYQEKRTAIGLAANGALVQLYTSANGTFTIVLTRPGGLSCLMAVGSDWQIIDDHTPVHRASTPLGPDRQNLPPA